MANVGEELLVCSLYICPSPDKCPDSSIPRVISVELLEKALAECQTQGKFLITKTPCGVVVAFQLESDADKLVERDLAVALDGPVQVARFLFKDKQFRQAVLLTDVPWAVPTEDLIAALSNQGIDVGKVTRVRQNIRVEMLDPVQYESILREGLDFFGATIIAAVPEKLWKNTSTNGQNSRDSPPNETVLQCYRCQGFWHVAAHCRHLPRCVRCGENHSVQYCTRPRHDPICCHCAGPHHAAYSKCPVRMQLENAMPVTISLTADRNQHPKQMWTASSQSK